MERNVVLKVTETTEKNEDVNDGVQHSNDVLKQSNVSLPAIWRTQILARQQPRIRLGKRRYFWRPC
jgi:hypothetical protein